MAASFSFDSRLWLVAAWACLIAGCGGSASGGGSSAGADPLLDFPRLESGTHLSIQRNFWPLSPSMEAAVQERLATARAAGMASGRIMFDWSELEPAPEDYDLFDLVEAVEQSTERDEPLLITVPIVDTAGYTLPADLMNAAGTALAPGLALDDQLVVGRLLRLLDAMAAQLGSEVVFALSLANEPEANADAATLQALAVLLRRAREHLRARHPALAVTATLTSTAVLNREPAVLALLRAGDAAMLNYYRPEVDGSMAPLGFVEGDMDRLLEITAPRQIFFQELGCTAGLPVSPLGATAQGQADFFALVLARIEREQRMRGASIFQLFDLADGHWALWEAPLRAEFEAEHGDVPLVDELVEQVRDYWVPVGLGRSDGSMRPSWDVVLEAISRNAD